jgi:hypothetical protein
LPAAAAAAAVLLSPALSFLAAAWRTADLAAVAFVACAAAAAAAFSMLTDAVAIAVEFAGKAAVLFLEFVIWVVTIVLAGPNILGTALALGFAAAAAAAAAAGFAAAALTGLLDAAAPPVDRNAALTAGVVISSPDAAL